MVKDLQSCCSTSSYWNLLISDKVLSPWTKKRHCSHPWPSQASATLSFVPPGWGANSLQNCHSCSFCSHKQRCWTVLSELWYEVASNLNTFFLSWKQRTAVKVVENALQYIKMYAAGVWAKTAKGYFKNVEEQVILLQSKVWSNL